MQKLGETSSRFRVHVNGKTWRWRTVEEARIESEDNEFNFENAELEATLRYQVVLPRSTTGNPALEDTEEAQMFIREPLARKRPPWRETRIRRKEGHSLRNSNIYVAGARS